MTYEQLRFPEIRARISSRRILCSVIDARKTNLGQASCSVFSALQDILGIKPVQNVVSLGAKLENPKGSKVDVLNALQSGNRLAGNAMSKKVYATTAGLGRNLKQVLSVIFALENIDKFQIQEGKNLNWKLSMRMEDDCVPAAEIYTLNSLRLIMSKAMEHNIGKSCSKEENGVQDLSEEKQHICGSKKEDSLQDSEFCVSTVIVPLVSGATALTSGSV
jgi:hypothetical protein